jgi:hypothetical protein
MLFLQVLQVLQVKNGCYRRCQMLFYDKLAAGRKAAPAAEAAIPATAIKDKPAEPAKAPTPVLTEPAKRESIEPDFHGWAEVLPDPPPDELAHASAVLAKAGVRLIGDVRGVDYIGVGSDTDGPEVRAALRVHGNGHLPVKYLDGDVPMRFKLRKVPGEPVPANVLAAMEQEPNQPWVVRDRMLAEMNWSPAGIPWAEWKAQSLNKLFQDQGALGQPAKITAAVVRHGDRKTREMEL